MSFSCLNLSNVFLSSLYTRDLQMKLWTIIRTLMSIRRTMARIRAASVKRLSGINERALKTPGSERPLTASCFT